MRQKLRTLAFALVPAIIMCCVIEGVAQVYWYRLERQAFQAVERQGQLVLRNDVINFLKVADPVLGYRLAPNLDIKMTNLQVSPGALLVRTTSQGFLQREAVAPERRPGSFRAMALGDSTTMGLDVDRGNFPAVLRRLLLENATGYSGGTEVINAGVAGYVSEQSALWAETELAGYRPDVVLLYSGFNDFQSYAPCDPPAQSSYFEQHFGKSGEFAVLSGLKSFVLARAWLARARGMGSASPERSPRGARTWVFREWQAESGATIDAQPSSGSQEGPLMSAPPGAFMWTGAKNASEAPAGRYVIAATMKGRGRFTLRITGLEKPWPLYQECPVELTPDATLIECAFTKPSDTLGVEVALVNGSTSQSLVSVRALNAHRPDEPARVVTACSDPYRPEEVYAFFLRSLDRLVASFRKKNPDTKIVISTLVGRWPEDTEEQFERPDGHIWWMAQYHLSRQESAAALGRFNAMIADYAAKHQLVLVDMAATFSRLDRQRLMWSFAHMTDEGYAIMARTFYETMLRAQLVSGRPVD